MADQMVGADVDQLDGLARDLKAAADQLESISKQLGGRIGAAPWQGHDATAFRHDWQRGHASALRTAAAAMRTAAGVVTTDATEQRHASQSTGHAPSRASQLFTDFRHTAGSVGDAAETVQVLADGVAIGAGGIAAVGLFVPGVGWVDTVAAGSVAATAAGVSETAGIVSTVGHGIEHPTGDEFREDLIIRSTTAGLGNRTEIDAIDATAKGAVDAGGKLIDAFDK